MTKAVIPFSSATPAQQDELYIRYAGINLEGQWWWSQYDFLADECAASGVTFDGHQTYFDLGFGGSAEPHLTLADASRFLAIHCPTLHHGETLAALQTSALTTGSNSEFADALTEAAAAEPDPAVAALLTAIATTWTTYCTTIAATLHTRLTQEEEYLQSWGAVRNTLEAFYIGFTSDYTLVEPD